MRTLTMFFFRQCGYALAISVKILDHHCPLLLDPQLGWEPVPGHCSCKGFVMALHFVLFVSVLKEEFFELFGFLRPLCCWLGC